VGFFSDRPGGALVIRSVGGIIAGLGSWFIYKVIRLMKRRVSIALGVLASW